MSRPSEPPAPSAAAVRDLQELSTGLVGVVPWLAVELIALDGAPLALVWVVVTLFAALGLAIGAVLAVQESLVAGLGLRGLPAAAVRSAGVLVVLAPVARHLFDGAFASTLPGAAWGFVWAPAAGYAATVAAVWLATSVLTTPARLRATGFALLVLSAATELTNRNAYRSEYPDIHTLLLVASCVGCGLGLRMLGVPGRPRVRPRTAARARTAIATAIVAAFALALAVGLGEPASRWTIATSGMHARLLVRVARAGLDRDGDGHAAVLGGPDCDDRSADIHPLAREVPGNDVDEDCDGVALAEAVAPPQRDDPDRTEELSRWRAGAEATAFVGRTRTMNILLVAVDALRADMLAPLPENEAAFPAMFALMAESRTFVRTFSPSAGTDLSMSSLMTGRIDPFSGVETTLAEAIDATGREGHAVIPTEVLRYVGRALLTRGLDGFRRLVNDKFEKDVGNYTTSHRTTDLGLAFLDRWTAAEDREPFFLWLHYFDVHEHDEIQSRDRRLREVTGGERVKEKRAKYRALVSLVDRELGRLMTELRRRRLLDQTIVVFLSDHGEALGEDPRLPDNHGKYVYNALVHVPLAIRIPGVPGATIDTPVSLVDLYPTLLDLAGASVPPATDGVSLLPHLVANAPADLVDPTRPIVLNESDQLGLIRWPHKLLVRSEDNLRELYDLEQDFAEQHDLSRSQPRIAAELLALYDAMPRVNLDRTPRGRWLRERRARAPK